MVASSPVDREFRYARRWRQEATALRKILLDCDLEEELKWRSPCYTSGGKNICIIQRMKSFLALMFFKGALLMDPGGILERQGPNSRAGYRLRFSSVRDVVEAEASIRYFVREAIKAEEAGLKIEAGDEPEYPEELVAILGEDPEFKAAFERLTPGRRRGYVLHFAGAKQSGTRVRRIHKLRSKILDGKGVFDR